MPTSIRIEMRIDVINPRAVAANGAIRLTAEAAADPVYQL